MATSVWSGPYAASSIASARSSSSFCFAASPRAAVRVAEVRERAWPLCVIVWSGPYAASLIASARSLAVRIEQRDRAMLGPRVTRRRRDREVHVPSISPQARTERRAAPRARLTDIGARARALGGERRALDERASGSARRSSHARSRRMQNRA